MAGGPKVKCKKCGDVIQSMSLHDMKWCKCGAIAVEVGGHYLLLLGELENIEVLAHEQARPQHRRRAGRRAADVKEQFK